MGVDPFAALGVDIPQPNMSVSGGVPTITVTPSRKGVDPFAALGIDPGQSFEPAQPTGPQVPPGKMTGWSPVIGAGIKRGVIGAISALTDPLLRLGEAPSYPPQPGPMQRFLEGIGGSPDEVQATTPGQKAAEAAAEGGAGMLALGGGALGGSVPRVLASLGKAAAAGAVGGVTGQAAESAAPDWAKPIAGFAGNLVGNVATEGAAQGAKAIARPVVRAAGEMGIGPKQDFGGVRATEPQLIAKGRQAQEMLGPEGRQQLNAATQAEVQARALEARLGDPATTPADRVDIQRQLNTLQPQRTQTVPGFEPTTAQVAPTTQSVGYESAMRGIHNDDFAAHGVAQNKALTDSLQGMAPGTTGPEAVGSMFVRQLDDLEARHAGQVAGNQAAVVGQTGALGGQAPIGTYGQEMRGAVAAPNAAAKAAEGALWRAIDPDGTLAMPLGDVQQTARGLLKEMNPNLGDAASGQEMQILSGAAALPAVIPFRDVQRLRSNIGTAERGLRAAPGNEQSLRRLGILKSSLDEALAQAAETAARDDPGLAERLSEFGSANGGQSVPGGGGREGVPEVQDRGQPGGQAGLSGAGGSSSEGQGRQGSSGSDRGVEAAQATGLRDLNPLEAEIYADLLPKPSVPGLEPNFSQEAADAYAQARQATLERKQTYGQRGVGAILRPGQLGEDFRVSRGDVPSEIFTRGPSEPEEVARFIKAAGGADKAASIGQNVLAHELIDRKIIRPDGTLDVGKFSGWQRQRRATIDQFPGLGDRFRNAQAAQVTLDQSIARQASELRDFQNGVAKSFLKDDPQVAIGRVFTSGNSTAAARRLYDAVKDSPDALAGARRGFIEHLDSRFNLSPENGSTIKSKSFRDFMNQHRNAFKIMFGGQGAQNIEMVEAALNRVAAAQQKEAAAGPNTARKILSMTKHGAIGAAGTTLFALLGERLGEHAMSMAGHEGIMGAVASAAGVAGGLWVHAMRQAGIKTMNDLGREMMLHPDLARALMQKADAHQALSAIAQRKIGAALQAAVLSDIASTQKGKDHGS